ncbi:MAG TPA: hypothetical protein VJ946_03725, partial [Bacteroidales bacterium]|nr:hypothetical protein [Bacteroidales bacterium]
MRRLFHIAVIALFMLITSGVDAQQRIITDSINMDTSTVRNQSKPLTRILFIFDSSQSMLGRWDGRRKIDVARNLLGEILDSLNTLNDVEIGLRVYGHQKPVPPQDCSDTKLEVPFSENNVDEIKYVLEGLVAKGTTPIARSLEEGA